MRGNGLPPIVGVSAAISQVIDIARRFAVTDVSILLVGPTGVGKDLLARHIHRWSGLSGELVDVNCGVIPRELADATLFGARRGAYTSSVESVTGLVEAAHRGTLFLNEACSLSLDAQVKLLDTLETGEYRPVGDHRKRRATFRVVAAVQDGMTQKVAEGTLRRDLYQRLAGVVIDVPPLAERLEDLAPLATYFAARRGQVLEPDAAAELANHDWPGNVRELRLVIERAGCLVTNGTLPSMAIRRAVALGGPVGWGRQGRRGCRELAHIREVGNGCGWDAERVASGLGLTRSGLYARLKRLGVSFRELRDAQESTLSNGRTVDKVDRMGEAQR